MFDSILNSVILLSLLGIIGFCWKINQILPALRLIHQSLVLALQIINAPNFRFSDYLPLIYSYCGIQPRSESIRINNVSAKLKVINTPKGCAWLQTNPDLIEASIDATMEAHYPDRHPLTTVLRPTLTLGWYDCTPLPGQAFELTPAEIGATQIRIFQGDMTYSYQQNEKVSWPPSIEEDEDDLFET